MKRLRAEVEELRRRSEQAREDAREVQEEARAQLSLIVGLMECFLGLLALVVGIIAYIGYSDRKEVKAQAAKVLEEAEKATAGAAKALLQLQASEQQAKAAVVATEATRNLLEQAAKGAGDAADQAKQAAHRAEEQARHIHAARESLSEAWGDIDRAFEKLPRLETSLVSDEPAIPPLIASVFEDCDVTLLVCDQLRIPAEALKSAAHFVKLAGFWRKAEKFPRALARWERARELAPLNPTIFREMALTLAAWAAVQPEGPPSAADRLASAMEKMEEAEKLQEDGPDLKNLEARAWILDEQGNFEKAAAALRQARNLDRAQAQQQGRSQNEKLSYNLACSLAKAGNFEEALTALAEVIHREPYWQQAKKELDFQKLRETIPWGEKLEKMIADAERASSSDPAG